MASIRLTAHYMDHQSKLIKIDKKSSEVEMPLKDDVKVRIPMPPVTFDDNGVIKRPTGEELKKLKGDSTLPGYPADTSNLKNGQMVSVHLVRNREAKPPAPMPGAGPASKAMDLDLTGDYVPHASLIVIVYDATPK